MEHKPVCWWCCVDLFIYNLVRLYTMWRVYLGFTVGGCGYMWENVEKGAAGSNNHMQTNVLQN